MAEYSILERILPDSLKLSHKTAIKLIMLLFCLGAVFGFLFEPTFTDILLQPEVNKMAATSISTIFIVRPAFSFFVALAFASIPLSAIIACNFTNLDRFYVWALFFMSVTIVTAIGSILYYRQYFSELPTAVISESSPAFDAAGISAGDIYIASDMLPYYKIPIISCLTSLILALIITGLKKIKLQAQR